MRQAIEAAGTVVSGLQAILDRGTVAVVSACLVVLGAVAVYNFTALWRLESALSAHRDVFHQAILESVRRESALARNAGEMQAALKQVHEQQRILQERLSLVVISHLASKPPVSGEGAQ